MDLLSSTLPRALLFESFTHKLLHLLPNRKKPRSCLVSLMATSLLSPLSSLTKELPSPMTALPKSSFLSNTRLFNFTASSKAKRRVERCYITPRAESLDHIPKQFREQNLKDGCGFSIIISSFLRSFLYILPVLVFDCSKNEFLLVICKLIHFPLFTLGFELSVLLGCLIRYCFMYV